MSAGRPLLEAMAIQTHNNNTITPTMGRTRPWRQPAEESRDVDELSASNCPFSKDCQHQAFIMGFYSTRKLKVVENLENLKLLLKLPVWFFDKF